MNNNEITTLLVDFDDTLYDTHGNAIIALKQVYSEFALNRAYPQFVDFSNAYWKVNEELWARYSRGEITRPFLIVNRFMIPLTEGGLKVTEQECRDINERFLELCCCQTGVVEGAYELLDYLKQRYRLFMASNGFSEVQYKKMEAARMTHYFDGVVLSEHAGVNKPSPLFFDYALKQAGVTAQQTLMIGDNFDTDIMGAMNAGIPQVFFNRRPGLFVPPKAPTFEVERLADIMRLL